MPTYELGITSPKVPSPTRRPFNTDRHSVIQGFCSDEIRLGDVPFVAKGDVYLSPQVRLLADAPGIKTFIFDGAGFKLILPEGMSPLDAVPLILVGTDKTLIVRNLTVVHASSFSAVIQLKAGTVP